MATSWRSDSKYCASGFVLTSAFLGHVWWWKNWIFFRNVSKWWGIKGNHWPRLGEQNLDFLQLNARLGGASPATKGRGHVTWSILGTENSKRWSKWALLCFCLKIPKYEPKRPPKRQPDELFQRAEVKVRDGDGVWDLGEGVGELGFQFALCLVVHG